MNTFISVVNGVRVLVRGISNSTGASDANKIISTDSNGRIDASFLSSLSVSSIYFTSETDGYSFNTANSLFTQDETDGYTIKVVI